jgi:pyrroline-5-carboxylate reductase
MTTTGTRSLAHISKTILLVGAGKMGSALLEGWLALGLDPKCAAVLEPKPARELSGLVGHGLRLNPAAGALGEAAAIVIAVKPQSAAEVVPTLTPYAGAGTVVVSVMAGTTLGFLE